MASKTAQSGRWLTSGQAVADGISDVEYLCRTLGEWQAVSRRKCLNCLGLEMHMANSIIQYQSGREYMICLTGHPFLMLAEEYLFPDDEQEQDRSVSLYLGVTSIDTGQA